jgi:UDP-glucose 4-epimerase
MTISTPARRVLLTGALGNLGQSTMHALLAEGHVVRAFDLPTKANRRTAKRLPPEVEVTFGDVTDASACAQAVQGVDAVIHLAAMIPPATERMPELARKVNVEGARHLIAAAEAEGRPIRFIQASSYSIYGPEAGRRGLVTAETPVVATDVYTATKIEVEELLRASTLDWVIFRIAAAVEGSGLAADPVVLGIIFEVDPEQPIELVHGKDVALAAAHAVTAKEASRRVFPIGGGPSCQLRQRDVFAMTERMLGIKPLPAEAFGKSSYYTSWLDTEESERVLRFQRHTAADIERDLAKRLALLKPLIFLVRPLVRRHLLSHSGPYRGDAPRPTWKAQLERA